MSKNYAEEMFKYSAGLKVLFVDDDEFIRKIATELLEGLFDIFDVAKDGKEAYELYKNRSYDIIISDIIMPVMDGIELATVIKQENLEQRFIVVSAHGDSDYILALTKLGVDGFIQKPVGKTLFTTLYKVSKCAYLEKKENDEAHKRTGA